MTILDSTIRNLIKIQRIRKNLSQREIAKRLHITQSTYSRIETGATKIDTHRLLELAKILEIDLEKVFRPSDDNKNSLEDLIIRQNRIIQEMETLMTMVAKLLPTPL